MAGKVRVVCDSTNCLPPELIERYHITVVPVGLVINGKPYRDLIDITTEQFCALVNTLEKPPTSSAANPGEFLTTFTELAKTADSIVVILVSRQLSATQECAYQARRLLRVQMPNVNIEIVDSKTSAGALGFIVLEAARAAEEGKSLEEVVRVTKDMVSRVVYLAAVDTLKHMIRMGRAPKNSSGVGEILNVKPIIGFVDDSGLISVVARVRGKDKSLAKVIELIGKYADGGHPLHVMVHYSDNIREAEQLRDMVTARYKCAEIYVTPYSPVMIGTTGPMVGLGFYS